MTETEFKNQIFLYTEYPEGMLTEFFDYWSEPNKRGKMKWELEKTWEIGRRLKRWYNNQNKWTNGLTIVKGGNKPGTSEARIAAAKNW